MVTDHKQSVLAEIASGRTNLFAYSAYGQRSCKQVSMTGLGFTGELREAGLDGYILGNGYRAYNPRLMRFHSSDRFSPFGKGGLNAYLYCGGEPMMRADPSGQGWFSVFATLNELFSGVGQAGGVVSKTKSVQTVKDSGFKTAVGRVVDQLFANADSPRLTQQKTGGRRARGARSKKDSHPHSAPGLPLQTSVNNQPPDSGAGAPGFVLAGNYGQRNQNAYTKMRTRDGLTIKGVESGRHQVPSTSSANDASRIRRG
ncbi:RHS repeat-associated core domain-containing protein [Pseudomonas violetae]|uniref:RHS repeat-associated core domain-containing protein n=1 Tax=Pseudomonas violetae TaxID=2915813 RepID=A0ABT0F0N5_9PSED|nr:RHS repeat-associated core domain-containing protein [Pseudomonas violetae]MCK1791568.1 RHS repeat-associated core domain-containing protein [Pseudomonas violetae]